MFGEPSHMRRTEASERTAKSWKMVSMQRAEMLSQSMKPSAYCIRWHSLVLWIEYVWVCVVAHCVERQSLMRPTVYCTYCTCLLV